MDWTTYLVPSPERANDLLNSNEVDPLMPSANAPCPACPNPFVEELHLQFPSSSGRITWEIRSSSGHLITQNTWNPELVESATKTLSTLHWPAGLYTLQWKTGHSLHRCKLVKGP
jgi:hypothetical protein